MRPKSPLLEITNMLATSRGRVRIETSEKRVRAYLGGWLVADSTHPVLVWEKPYYPTYYVPIADVRADLVPSGDVSRSPSRGDGTVYGVRVTGAMAPGAAIRYLDSPIEELRDLVRLDWDAMSEWLEEDEVVYTHPRDPYTQGRHPRRARGMSGSRSTASSSATRTSRGCCSRPGCRPATTCRWPTSGWTCFGGRRQCRSAPTRAPPRTGRSRPRNSIKPDIAWIYRTPLPESQKIAGLVSFYDERADVYVDGVLQDRPRSRFG